MKSHTDYVLFSLLNGDFDRAIFPTLADVLSSMEDKRIVKPTLEMLSQFRSPTAEGYKIHLNPLPNLAVLHRKVR